MYLCVANKDQVLLYEIMTVDYEQIICYQTLYMVSSINSIFIVCIALEDKSNI